MTWCSSGNGGIFSGRVGPIQNLDRRRRAEVFRRRPRAQNPDDLLLPIYFDRLNRRVGSIQFAVRPLVEPVVDNRIAVRPTGGSLQTGHLVVRAVRWGPLPDRLALPIEFADKASIAGGENVPVLERFGRPDARHLG